MSVLEKELSPAALRDNWIKAVEALYADVEDWAVAWHRARGFSPEWQTRRSDTRHLRNYGVTEGLLPILEINVPPREVRLTPSEHLVLEPIASESYDRSGRVDFYAYPSAYRVMLLLPPGGEWIVRTDSGIDWPHPWSEATFVELAEALLRY